MVSLGCAVLFLFSSLDAQSSLPGLTESWRWSWFSTESGLPPSVINVIVETPRGELWVLTRAGVAWYNGYYWQSPPANPSLPSLNRADLATDPDGVLLVVPPLLYRVDHDGYHAIPLTMGKKPLPVSRVVSLGKQGLLVQNEDGLYLLHDSTVQRFPSPLDDPATRSVPETSFGVYPSRSGTPYVNAPGGLYRWKGNRWEVLAPVKGDFLGLSGICDDASGNGILYGRVGTNMLRMEWNGQGILVKSVILPGDAMRTFDCDGSGSVVVLQHSGDAKVRSAQGWHVMDPIPPELIGATTILFDAHGDLWVGKTNGLHRCHLSSDLWDRLVVPRQGAVNTVNGLLFASDSSLWVGTSDGILVYRDNKKIREIPAVNGTRLGVVTGLAQDPQGHVWISSGSSFGGTYRWDGTSWKHFGAREGFSDNGVHHITRDKQGRLWFLTISFFTPGLYPELEDGAFIYDGSQFVRMDTRNGLPDGRVYAVAEDSAGGRWFATNKGIGYQRGEQWKYWTSGNGLRSNKVFILTVDRNDRLWFGHQTQGLGYIDSRGVPVYVTPEQGFTGQGAWDLLVDYAGRLWVATHEGLAVLDRGEWGTISLREGLPNPNTWPLVLRDSVLYVGMTNAGVAALRLARLEGSAPIVRFNEPVDRGDMLTLSWQTHGTQHVPIGHENSTRYRLDGGVWSQWATPRPLDLPNLPSGEHVIAVQARGPLAQVDDPGYVFRFTVPPPFYLRSSFLVPVGVLTGLLLLLAVSYQGKRLEHSRQLRERDARLRAVLDQQSELIVRILPDGVLSFVNGAVCRTLRQPAESLIGRPFADVFRSDAPLGDVATLWAMRPGGESFEIDARSTAGDGRDLWLRWVSGAIADSTGATREFQVVGHDITDTKIAEQDLQRSEERYRIMAEATGQLVYEYNMRTGVISWQGAVTAVTGYTPDEFQSVDIARWEELLHPDDRERVVAELRNAKAAKTPFHTEYRLRQKGGTYLNISENGVFVGATGAVPVCLIGTVTDISARKQVELQVAASLKEKEVLLKEIHHRVKNNLQVISSLLSLQSNAATDPHAQEQLRESQNRIRSMALIHERLYQSENLARINFEDYVRSLGAFLFRSYNVQGIRFLYKIDQCTLPVDSAIPCGLIINELVSNSLKYAFKGRTEGEIEIGFVIVRKTVAVLSIRDNGIGFPRDLDFRTTQTLGMQLVNTLTAQINGTIGLVRDRGTTFSITMPLES
jgi:PAS domain S-box-containing protein